MSPMSEQQNTEPRDPVSAQSDADLQVAPADAVASPLLVNLPAQARPYLSLARIDRPVGIWLLALPCWIGLAFMAIPGGLQWIDLWWAALFAYIFLGAQLFVGFLIWLCLPLDAKIVAFLAIPLVAAYPYMKRITFWPQAWLGLTFNWGILVAAATTGNLDFSVFVLFSSMALWTIAYDTIYALQDREDDALIGVKSTARLFGGRAVTGAFVFHLGATAQMSLAAFLMGAGRVGAITGLLFLAHGLWQSTRLKQSNEQDALAVFKSNVWAGAIVLGGFVLAAIL